MKTKITSAKQAWKRVKFLEGAITRAKRSIEWCDAHPYRTFSSDVKEQRAYDVRQIAKHTKEAAGLLARLIRLPKEANSVK